MRLKYVAKNLAGATVKGVLDSDTLVTANQSLRARGYIPIDISPYSSLRNAISSFSERRLGKLFETVSDRSIMVFFQQMHTMVTAGITIDNALMTLSKQTYGNKLDSIIPELYEKIRNGIQFSDAVSKYPCFGTISSSVLRGGEASGTIDTALERLYLHYSTVSRLKSKLISAVSYPFFVILCALTTIIVVAVFIVPNFLTVFSTLKVKPPLTIIVLNRMGLILRSPVCLIIGLTTVLLLIIYIRRQKKSFWGGKIVLKIPIIGSMFRKAVLSRTFKTFSTLLASGVPITQSLILTGNTSGNKVVSSAFSNMSKAAESGVSISEAASREAVFTPMILNMLLVGESSGSLDSMSERIGQWYETELEESINRLSSMIEPILIIFVGIIVFTIVLSLFLPIITAMESLM